MTLHKNANSIPNERPTCAECGVGMWLHCVETVDRWSQKRTYQCQACGGAASIILKIDQGRVTDELARGLFFLVVLSRDLYRTIAIIHHDGRMQILNLRRRTVFAFVASVGWRERSTANNAVPLRFFASAIGLCPRFS